MYNLFQEKKKKKDVCTINGQIHMYDTTTSSDYHQHVHMLEQ